MNKGIRTNENDERLHHVWCEPCKTAHGFNTKPGGWTMKFNAEGEPTVKPSLKVKPLHEDRSLCHFFITDGHIQYLSDCAHDKAGETVPMSPWPDNYGF